MIRSSLFVAALFIALFPVNTFANDVDEISTEYCKCVEPAFKEISKLQSVMQSGDMAAMNSAVTTMKAQQGQMTACMEKLDKKYGHLKDDEAFGDKVNVEIKKKCPPPNFGPGPS